MERPRTVVVGGGIAGCAVALGLRERGVPVTVVDRGRPGGEATRASAGMLAAQYEASGPDPGFRLAVRGRDLWPDFHARLGELAGRAVPLRRDGMLVANRGPEEDAAARAAAAWQREAGLQAELVGPAEAAELQPGVGEATSWLWLPGEAQVDSQALAGVLEPALRKAGAELRVGQAVETVRSRGAAVRGVRLSGGGTLPAERVVVAAGAWTGRLAGLPRGLPVRPVRGQMLRLRAPPGLRRILADHAGRYVVPRDDGTLLAGSTMEEAGFDPSVTPEGLDRIRRGARRLFPELAACEEIASWAGLRPVAPDGLPVLGADPELGGLLYATGYGRNGILLAPAAARLLARLALGEEPEADPTPFRPDRFD